MAGLFDPAAFTFSSIGITPVQAAGLPDTTADVVYGQAGSFTTNTPNNGGISANSLAMPVIDKVSVTDGMYVTDWANSRVLFFPPGIGRRKKWDGVLILVSLYK